MRAKIHWNTREEGGRTRPPAGVGQPPYATIVRFKDSTEPRPAPVEWSLVVEKASELSNEYDWVANVRFLVNEAPMNELRVGREFELFEGWKCVATGVLIGAATAAGSR